MKVLIVDRTTEQRAMLAKRIDSINPYDAEALNLNVQLADVAAYQNRIADCDVLLIGPGLEDDAKVVAHRAREAVPHIEIIMFVSTDAYSSEAFRAAHSARVRKVLPANASELDLLQELIRCQEEFHALGRMKRGELIVVTHAKGGVGATSFCAGLAETCAAEGRSVLLWDLDVQTADLTSALLAAGAGGRLMTSWVKENASITRHDLARATATITRQTAVLPPPDDLAAGLDLVNHADCLPLMRRLMELARLSYQTVIVDTAGQISPAAGMLIRAADRVLMVIDDSLIGMAAARMTLESLKRLLPAVDRFYFVCSGTKLTLAEIRQEMALETAFAIDAWSLPAVPYDRGSTGWAGSSAGLLAVCRKETKAAFHQIAVRLELAAERSGPVQERPGLQRAWASWRQYSRSGARLLPEA